MAKLTTHSIGGEVLACACALFGAAGQAQTLNLPATLSSGAYAASSTVTNCTGTVSQANCTSVTLANNATVTLAAATQIVLGPGFTAVAGNASTSLVAAIVPAPTVSAVAVSPASVISGGSATITVTLSSNALYAVAVALTSSNTAAFNPPASITIAAGQISGSATVTAGTVSASTPVTVTGSYNSSSRQGSVTVLPPQILLTSVSVNPSSVISTNSATVTVTLSGVAPSGGAVVTLGSNNASAFNPPASITVAAGQTANFATVYSGTVSASTPVTVTGSYGATQTGSVTVLPLPTVSAIAVTPSTVLSGGSVSVAVTLSAAAPASGAVVYLGSTNQTALNPPAGITVAAGQTSGSVLVTAATAGATASATVTGTYNGTSQSGPITVVPPPDFTITLTPTLNPATAMVGGSATFTVAVSSINGFNGTVALTAVGLPTGASATFSPSTITASGTSTMTVTAPSSGTGNFTVTANGASGSLSHSAVSTLAVQDFTVTLSGYNYASPPTIPSGGTQTFTIGTAGINGFTGNIALTYGQYTPDGGCGLNNLSMPSQVTAGSAVSIVLTPYTANCFFQITANASGDSHVLLGAVFVSSAANFGFTLPVGQGTLTATPGSQSASVVFTPTLTIVNNFCGTVIFQVTGLPTGATYTAPSVYLCANSPQTAQITVTVPPGTPQSTSQLTIDAFGSNGNAGQASSQYIYPYLQVGSGGSTFSISASPPQTTAPGGTAQYTITVNGSSGLGNVTLTATGGPPGSTVLFNGSTSAVVGVPGSATMAVATPTNEGLGTYAVPITGMLGTVPKYSSASLTVAALSPSHMLAPANGGFLYGGNTAFTWTPGVGATQYTLTVTPANGQSTSVVVNPSATPGATVSLPTANQSITATLLTYTASGPLPLQTYSYIVNPQPGTQAPVLDTTQQQPSPYIPNNGIESQPYTYHFTGGDARAMAEGECIETEVAVRMVLLTQTSATLAFTGAQGAKPQASALNCTCPGGPVPINPPPVPVDTTPVITGVTSPIQANLSQTIHITGMYFGDPTAGANDTVQICQNGAGGCTSADAELLDDYDILATVTLAAGNYTVFVFSNGAAGEGFSGAPGGSDESNGADLLVEAAGAPPTAQITMGSSVVSGNAANSPAIVSVGQQIQLTGSVINLGGLTVVSQLWTIGGTTVKSYQQTLSYTNGNISQGSSTGVSTPLGQSDLSQQSITFYWIDGDDCTNTVNYTVTYTATLSDQSTVSAPSAGFRPVRPCAATAPTQALTFNGVTTTATPAITFSPTYLQGGRKHDLWDAGRQRRFRHRRDHIQYLTDDHDDFRWHIRVAPTGEPRKHIYVNDRDTANAKQQRLRIAQRPKRKRATAI